MPNHGVRDAPNRPVYQTAGSIVRDEVTRLTWLPAPPAGARSFDDAASTCLAAGDAEVSLRLPSRVELVTALDATGHPSWHFWPAERFWTGSHPNCRSDEAYVVDFASGETTITDVTSDDPSVVCVADSPRAGPTGWVAGTEVVLDRGTGLRWDRSVSSPLKHSSAAAHCVSASSRLPTLNELQTIVDESRADPALDTAAFHGGVGELWTATVRDDGSRRAWVVDFQDGKTRLLHEDERRPARCVGGCEVGPHGISRCLRVFEVFEIDALCAWYADLHGGAHREVECGERRVTHHTRDECVAALTSSIRHCWEHVSRFEECAVRQARDPCDPATAEICRTSRGCLVPAP